MTHGADGLFAALSLEHRTRLLAVARETNIPADTVIFEEDEPAERFWIIRSGRVALDFQIPGRGSVIVETIGPGELLGWSWLFEPFHWQLGARTLEPVAAHEFDATTVRGLVEADQEFGLALTTRVATTIGQRLRACRARLIDMYEPLGVAPGGGGIGP